MDSFLLNNGLSEDEKDLLIEKFGRGNFIEDEGDQIQIKDVWFFKVNGKYYYRRECPRISDISLTFNSIEDMLEDLD